MRKYQLGQHFLRSPKFALMLVGHSNIKKRDLVLDIGAGSGVISFALSKKCREVWAIESDHETAEMLRKNLERYKIGNVKVIEKDFLEVELPGEPYKVFANPPFQISSKIVHKLLEAENQPESFYLILQKQFALKLLNTDRHYTSQLGQALIQEYQTKIKYPLKNTDFTPPPAVPTVLFEGKRISSLPTWLLEKKD